MDLFLGYSVPFWCIGVLFTLRGVGYLFSLHREGHNKAFKAPMEPFRLSPGFPFLPALTRDPLHLYPKLKISDSSPIANQCWMSWMTDMYRLCFLRLDQDPCWTSQGQCGEFQFSRFPPLSFYPQISAQWQDILAGPSKWLKAAKIFVWGEKDEGWFCNHCSPQGAPVQSDCSCEEASTDVSNRGRFRPWVITWNHLRLRRKLHDSDLALKNKSFKSQVRMCHLAPAEVGLKRQHWIIKKIKLLMLNCMFKHKIQPWWWGLAWLISLGQRH